VKQRMAQNEFIERQGGVQALKQQEQQRIEKLKNKNNPEPIAELPESKEQRREEEQGRREQEQIRKEQENQEQIRNEQGEQEQERGQKQRRSPKREQAQRLGARNPEIHTGQPQNPPQDEEQEKEEQDNALKRFNRGMTNVRKTIQKPIWDSEKSVQENTTRLVGKVLSGVAGATVGIAAATVQAGISITDGKYNPIEGVATIGAGIAGVSQLSRNIENREKENMTIQEYGERWFNRDDVIGYYNREFAGQGKDMRRRAVNNYVSRGIVDVNEQKQAMKYAELLKKERGLHEEEADKIAIATLQYKQRLTRNSNYMILYDKKKRREYLDIQADAYTGSASKDTVRQLHDDLIENVRDFDRANN